MSWVSRLLVLALPTVLAGTLALTVDGAAVASSSGASQAVSATAPAVAAAAGQDRVDLRGDAVLPRAARGTAKVKKWKVRTIYYYSSLPAKWDWSLSTAVAKWNASGGRIRLARIAKPAKAQLGISNANIGAAAGKATVGSTRHAHVWLSSRFNSADAVSARNRVTVMIVLAHELGHVLGFGHTSARCSLMAPVINIDACQTVPATQPGYYKCRTLDSPLVQRFIRLYGGRARYPSTTWCLIDPLPPVLGGVTFSGGTTAPVTVHWNRPTSVPAGSTLVVRRWETATCGTAPVWADTFRPTMASGVWQDQPADEDEVACFQVQLVNRYGAGPAAQKRVLSRWVPPVEAPEIGTPSYDFDTEQFTFEAIVAQGTTLHALWDSVHPTTCVTTPTEANHDAFVPIVEGQSTLTPPSSLPQCVSFFAFDQETNRYSDPVFVTFTEPFWPDPSAPVIGTPTYDLDAAEFTVPVTLPDAMQLQARWNSADPTSCVTQIGDGDDQAFTLADDVATVGASGTFPRCVSFFAHDDQHNRTSAATQVTFTVPPDPVPLQVGTATWDSATSRFHASATYPVGTHLVYRMDDDPNVCPGLYTSGQPVVEDEDRLGPGVIEFSTVYPKQCISFYAVDDTTGQANESTSMFVEAALPTETPTVGPITMLDKNFYPWRQAELTGAAPGNKVGYAVVAGACPSTAPAVSQWRTQLQGDMQGSPADRADYGIFPSVAAGANCVLFTSLDWFGWEGSAPGQSVPATMLDRHGPVVMREFVDDGPLPPTVGTPTWNEAHGQFEIPVSNINGLKVIYDPSDPTTCPAPGAVGAQAVPFVLRSQAQVDLTPPASHSCLTFYNLAAEGPVPMSAGTPVDLTVPQGG